MRRISSVTVLALLASVVAPTAAAPAQAAVKTAKTMSCSSESAGDASTAALLAKRCREPVEVGSDQTAYAQVTANANGTMTYTSSVSPRWVERNGSWIAASADLVENKDGTFSPEAAESSVAFSGGGSRVLATASTSQGTMTVSWPTALPVPSVSGASATYPDVLSGVNLVVTAEVTGGFEESLVVENADAAKDPGLARLVLDLSTSKGLTSAADKAGDVTVRNAKGGAVFFSPAPRAWDSSKDARPVAVPVSYRAGTATMSVPTALLDAKGTEYPVIIDPSYTVSQTSESYDEIQSAYPTSGELDGTYDGGVAVGYDGGSIDRGYFNFGLPSAAEGETSDVLSATVSTTVSKEFWDSSVSHTVDVYETDQATSSTTWDDQATELAGPQTLTYTTDSYTPDLTETINVASWVQSLLQASGPDLTLGLVNSSEAETNTSAFTEFSGDATLSITYDLAPWSVKATSLSPVSWDSSGTEYTSTTKPTFSASDTSPESSNLSYQFDVYSGSTLVESGVSSSVASGATGSWTATTALTNGDAYTVESRAYDGTEYGAWSPATSFTVDTNTPAAPAVSCSGYPADSWNTLVSGGVTCSLSDSVSGIDGYSYGLADGSAGVSWQWTTGSSITIDPAADGLYTLKVLALDDAGVSSTEEDYVFGVGGSAMISPLDGSQTSGTLYLQAAAPSGSTGVTYEYRLGTTGTFTEVPSQAVFACGCSGQWPAATVGNATGVESAVLTWDMTKTISDDGLVQVEAVFSDSSGDTVTTSPVSVTLSRTGSGVDFGSTTAGPVTVGLQSGNAALSATDVNVSSYGANLTVGRTFNSVNPSVSGIFGPGWVSDVGSTQASDWSSVTDDGSYAVLTAGDGSTYTFTEGSTSGSTVSYTADASATTSGLTLTKNTSTDVFDLTDSSNDVTGFTHSSTDADFIPSSITSPGTTSSTGFVYNSSGDPLLVVAPDAATTEAPTTACPSPASSSTWTAGCRGLSFDYTTAGDVSEIDLVYVDNSGTYHDVAVAEYFYDSSGRLTSEWDPRLSTSLVTGYTYDETSTDADYGRITEYTPAQASGSNALASWKFTYDDTATDVNYGKVLTVSRTHSSTYGGTTATDTIDYDVPLTEVAGGPIAMDTSTVATWNQTDVPTSAVAIWPGGYTPSSTTDPTATDYEYATIDYFDASGRQVNTATYVDGAWAVSTTQYENSGDVTSTLTAADRATALASASTVSEAQALSTINEYACDDFGAIGTCTSADQSYEVQTDSYSPAHSANVDGVLETERDHTAYAYDVGAPNSDEAPSGAPYMLQTSMTTSASIGSSIPGSSTADSRTTKYLYTVGSDETGWTLGEPLETVTDPSGLDVISSTAYNENSSLYNGDNLVIDKDQPADSSGGTAGDTHIVYYTAGSNSQVSSCGDEPEWTNLICETYPTAQPSDTSTIPTTAYTYNDYQSPLVETKTYGSTGTETITYTYDGADRQTGESIAVSGSGMGTAPPATATVYNTDTGAQSDTETLNSSGAVTSDVNTGYDDFGQMVSYTDANDETTTYSYDLDGQGVTRSTPYDTDTMTYSSGGQPVKEVDGLAGTFTATYNADGALQTETYPDGTAATYTTNADGTATQLTYSNGNWAAPIADSVTVDAQGDWSTESILNDSKTYTYDNDDRLTAVADTDAGSCTTRGYTYDADSNRTSLTTYAAAGTGACQTSTASSAETYSYDTADRLESTTESGTTSTYTYDTQGDITSTPSVDAGGAGNLVATYYADGLLDSQTQGGTTDSYTLDGTLDRYAAETDSATGFTTVNDYSDSTDSPSWSTTNGSRTENVVGLDGGLAATVTSAGAVTLQLTDLRGDIIATVNPASDAAPEATYTYTEFGSLDAGSDTPAAYGYLGSDERSDDALGATILMGVRGYNVDTGRFSSVDPVFEGSANAYDYVNQNPVTGTDLSGNSGNREGVVVVHSGDRYEFTLYLNHTETKWLTRFVGKAGLLADALAVLFPPIAEFAGPIGVVLDAFALFLDWLDHNDRGIYVNTFWYKISWWWFGSHTAFIPYFLWVGGQ